MAEKRVTVLPPKHVKLSVPEGTGFDDVCKWAVGMNGSPFMRRKKLTRREYIYCRVLPLELRLAAMDLPLEMNTPEPVFMVNEKGLLVL